MDEPPMSFLSSRIVYESPWIKIREDFVLRSGKKEPYSVTERADSVVIIPWSELGSTMVLKQYRYPTREYAWEFPGGSLRPGETTRQTAIRELREETGLRAHKITMIGEFHPLPALAPQLTSVFVAELPERELRADASVQFVDDIVDARVVGYDELRDMVHTGQISDGLTLASIALLNWRTSEVTFHEPSV